jgi:RimJ/RimL family protein N-acetyltransferase
MADGALEPVLTERLLLRLFRPGDLDDVTAFQADPEIVRYLYWEPRSRDESREWLAARIAADRLGAEGDAVALAVERRSDGRVIGSVNAWWRSVEHRQAEIGYVLVGDAHGQGFAYEATAALLDVLFPMLDLHRVYASTDARNSGSAALLGRLGMRQEAHLRENEWFKGAWGDELIFAILRREWEQRRSLEASSP